MVCGTGTLVDPLWTRQVVGTSTYPQQSAHLVRREAFVQMPLEGAVFVNDRRDAGASDRQSHAHESAHERGSRGGVRAAPKVYTCCGHGAA